MCAFVCACVRVCVSMLSNDSCVFCLEWVCEYVRACVRVCMRVNACVHVPNFNNGSSIGLGYEYCLSGAILGNIISCAHTIHRPCSYFQRVR